MKKGLTKEEKLIAKVWWVVCGILLAYNNGKKFACENDILELINTYRICPAMNKNEIKTIIETAYKYCPGVMSFYIDKEENITGYRLSI